VYPQGKLNSFSGNSMELGLGKRGGTGGGGTYQGYLRGVLISAEGEINKNVREVPRKRKECG